MALTFNPENLLEGANAIHVAGRWLLMGTENAVVILDIDQPLQPRVLSTVPIDKPTAIAVQFRYAFVTSANGLQTIDITDPAKPRLAATLLGTLGGFGLLLAMIGVYGLMTYVVKQRRHAIGIHLALGAPVHAVLALVIRQGMTVCLAGAAIGLGITLAAARLFGSVLYGISGADPLTYVAVPTVLLGVALLACYVPARDATKVNPVEALRAE